MKLRALGQMTDNEIKMAIKLFNEVLTNPDTDRLAWDMLDRQGFEMSSVVARVGEMWMQEHHTGSSMEQHVHGFGVQIVGFYFLEVPDYVNSIQAFKMIRE